MRKLFLAATLCLLLSTAFTQAPCSSYNDNDKDNIDAVEITSSATATLPDWAPDSISWNWDGVSSNTVDTITAKGWATGNDVVRVSATVYGGRFDITLDEAQEGNVVYWDSSSSSHYFFFRGSVTSIKFAIKALESESTDYTVTIDVRLYTAEDPDSHLCVTSCNADDKDLTLWSDDNDNLGPYVYCFSAKLLSSIVLIFLGLLVL